MKVVVATDKYKGSLTAAEACRAIAEGVAGADASAAVVTIPLADGGEGTEEVLFENGDRYEMCEASDPLGRKAPCRYFFRADGAAVIAMSQSAGLWRLKKKEYDPQKTSSYGFGEMIRDAYGKGGREFILAIGGSATADCGMGMLAAMGLSFFDSAGGLLEPCGANVVKIAKIGYSRGFGELRQCRFTVLSDVDNPLLGENGGIRVYSPQKGADAVMVESLEKGAASFVSLINRERCEDVANIPFGGAAGGVGMALLIFLGAEMVYGARYVIEQKHVEEQIVKCDLVITGEGRVDKQTLSGKLVSGILAIAKKYNKHTVVLCGAVADGADARTLGCDAIYPLVDEDTTPEIAIKNAAVLLREKSAEVIGNFVSLQI